MSKNTKVILISLVAFLTFLLFLKTEKTVKTTLVNYNEKIKSDIQRNTEIRIKDKIENSQIEAKAVSVYDFTLRKTVYSKDDQTVLPLASLTKIMTAVIALENTQENVVTISANSLNQFGEYGLIENEIWPKNDLIKFGLITSSNDAAFALSEKDPNFIIKMNSKAGELGLNKLTFNNPTGLDWNSTHAGGYGNAYELNQLSYYALSKYPEIFKATTSPVLNFISASGNPHVGYNTNQSVANIPNLLFSKTGFTESAGGNLSVIFQTRNKNKIGVTILGSSMSERFSDIEKITGIVYDEYNYE